MARTWILRADSAAAVVVVSVLATFFSVAFFVVCAELHAANGALRRARDARTIAREAFAASVLAELADLRRRRDRGELPPVVARSRR